MNNATSQQGCDLQNGMAGCRKLCIRSSFERRCCDSYYGSDCTGIILMCDVTVDCVTYHVFSADSLSHGI